jgi:tetratricopeptide (TPR) repeat protein
MRRLIVSIILIAPVFALAQNKKPDSAALAVNNRNMSQIDSLVVKQLFFSALGEKIIGNNTHAAELFTKVLQLDMNNDAAMYELAAIKKKEGNYHDAQALMEHAVTVSPDNEWYWLSLADCYEKSNNLAPLENVFDELIRIDPDKPEYYFNKGKTYFLEKKYDDALKAYDLLQQMNGLDDDLLAARQKIYLIQGRVDLATADINQMIVNYPGQVRYYLLLAEIYNSNGYTDKALKALQDAEKVDAGNGQLHLALADIYRDKKDNDACFNELKLAFAVPDLDIDQKIKILMGYVPKFPDPNAKESALILSKILITAHPTDSRAFAVYGDMLFQNDNYKGAEDAYRRSVMLDSNHYEVYEQLVRLELGNNEIDNALKDGQDALSLFPNQAWMNYLVGIAYVQKKDLVKGMGYLKNTASIETDDKDLLSLTYSALGDLYHEQKDDKSSDDAYGKALTYNPDNAFALNNYAYYLSLRDEQLDRAAQMSAHSNELQPNTASFEDTYAWILFKQKKYADAKVWIEKAILHDKTNSAVQLEHYGDIMFYLGDTNAAVESWKKARSQGQQSPVLDRKINERKYIE